MLETLNCCMAFSNIVLARKKIMSNTPIPNATSLRFTTLFLPSRSLSLLLVYFETPSSTAVHVPLAELIISFDADNFTDIYQYQGKSRCQEHIVVVNLYQ